MVKLLVLADDFTGALDTGVQFSARGIPTLVMVEDEIDFHSVCKNMQAAAAYSETPVVPASNGADIRVIVVDLESRHIPAGDAAKKVADTVKQAIQCGVEYFYKKTDSTLRGNIGAELSALLEASGSNRLAFVPAYPKTGRTTENGCQYVNGIPLHQTVFAKDPLDPISNSYIPAIIKAQSDCDVVISKLSQPDCSADDEQFSQSPAIIVYDAKTDQDLLKIGRFLKRTDHLHVTAGCAGFAAVLPDLPGLLPNENTAPAEKLPAYDQTRTLTICGSINQVSLEQVCYAENHGWCSITIPPEALLHNRSNENSSFPFQNEITEKILAALSSKEKLVIKTLNDSKDISAYISCGENLGLDKKEIHLRIAHNMGLLVKRILAQTNIGTVVVFGGDTALGIMEAMGWAGLKPRDEILPGVAVSEVLGSGIHNANEWDNLHKAAEKRNTYLITKAGGFGDKDVLLKIDHYLTEKR